LLFGSNSLRLFEKLSFHALSVLFESIKVPLLQNSLQKGLVFVNEQVFQVFILVQRLRARLPISTFEGLDVLVYLIILWGTSSAGGGALDVVGHRVSWR